METPTTARRLDRLPKAHLHLHFTGSMRHDTLVELAEERGVHLPQALVKEWPPKLRATDERGWFRFQRLYDIARSVLRKPEDIHRLLREAQALLAGGPAPAAGWDGNPVRQQAERTAARRVRAAPPRTPCAAGMAIPRS